MEAKNTRLSYGTVAKTLHWLTALGFLAVYCTIYYARLFEINGTPEYRMVREYHFLAGITVAMIILPRVVWKILNIQPAPEPGLRWQHLSAHTAHWMLYLVMIVMPITGWMVRGGATDYFGFFTVPGFRGSPPYEWLVTGKLGLTFEQFRDPIRFFHRDISGRWFVWSLIMVHAAAALYHHFAMRDNTLRKMLPRRKIQ